MIAYDQWYKNRQKSVSFSGHISDGLSVVSVRAEPHKGHVTESVELSSIMPKPGSEGHGKSGQLSDRLRRKAPRRYFTFSKTDATTKYIVMKKLSREKKLLHKGTS